MKVQAIAITSLDRNGEASPAPAITTRRLQELLRFGGLMLSAGETAFRARRSMGAIAWGLGFESLSIQFGARNLIASGSRDGETATLVCDVGVPSVNTERIGALEALARTVPPDMNSRELAAKLATIETASPRRSIAQTATAIGAACGAFAFLNGGAWIEVAACVIGGGVGQGLKSFLICRRFNQYAVTALCAVVASAVYCVAAALAHSAGLGVGRSNVGLVSSVLFLIPGFSLVTALLDQLHHETGAALSRLAHAMMFVLTAAVGLSVVIALVGFSIEPSPQHILGRPLMIAGWAIASFCGGCGLAIVYNGTWRNVLYVGMIALIGNEVRLLLHDGGVPLPLATFLGALAVGLTASVAGRWTNEARVALTVPAVVMMVPGLSALETLIYFDRGEILQGLSAGVLVGFVVGSIAFGLAAARFISQPEWLRE
ncbi:MAG TPA: threonine/serine exporter family protein [Pyrinomonadaceae bacterium]|nr:threonine/serine exporter family protein [Pyrinomonadaceae bacterium]